MRQKIEGSVRCNIQQVRRSEEGAPTTSQQYEDGKKNA
jgi:hypothetical protein